MTYDSRPDTRKHISKVRAHLYMVMSRLSQRADVHDASKLVSPEVEAFDVITPKLAELEYGSDGYRASLREMKPAIDHHYANNSHHPEHYEEGVAGMSLLDVVEMVCDWRAASERHEPATSFEASLAHNVGRFEIEPQLASVIRNTARELGWLDADERAAVQVAGGAR